MALSDVGNECLGFNLGSCFVVLELQSFSLLPALVIFIMDFVHRIVDTCQRVLII